MDRQELDSLNKPALIELLVSVLSRIEVLEAENARLKERLAQLEAPAKTPDNSSTPPSLGRKANRPKLSVMWPGMVLTVVVWIVLAAAYSLYLRSLATFAITYAGLSGIFAAMFFVYLAALVLIFGGEINRVVALRMGAKPEEPADLPATDGH
jgi:hypothetical protein